MSLSEGLVSQFAKIINDRGPSNNDFTVYGTIVEDGSRNYVRLDGSDISTPIETTVEVSPGDRVIVEVKNHMATVTGNTTNPSIGIKTKGSLESRIEQTETKISSEVLDGENSLASRIVQLSNKIENEVLDEKNGLASRITQTADSVSSIVEKQGEFSALKQTLEGFSFMGKGGTVKISGGDIELSGKITFDDIGGSLSLSDLSDGDSVGEAIDAANTNASSALVSVLNLLKTTTDNYGNVVYTTYIDGRMIYSDSIYASSIHLGGALSVYKTLKGTAVGGYLGYDSGFNSTSGIGIRDSTENSQMVCTNAAARLSYGNPNGSGSWAQFITNSSGYAYVEASARINFGIGNSYFISITDHSSYGSLRPHDNAPYNMHLGTSSYRWGAVYATNGTIQTSDRNSKHNIEDLPDKYLTMFDSIHPRRFKMNEGTSDRYHVGYIAQEVEEAMNAAGIDSQEFGGFVRDKDKDGNDICMLRYGEFDAIYAAKIKQLERRIIELENQVISK